MGARLDTASESLAVRREAEGSVVAVVVEAAGAAGPGVAGDAGASYYGSTRTSSATMSPRRSSRTIIRREPLVAKTVYDSLIPALQIV